MDFTTIPIMPKSFDDRIKQLLFLIHNIFEKYNIFYGLGYGTLLGAIRHHDRIPWDDDADIFIIENDEYKLKNINWNKLLPHQKNGTLFVKEETGWKVKLNEIIKNRYYIDQFLEVEE